MIMFKNDFALEGAYVHDNTSNSSFIRMSMLLQRMNVRNSLFPLAIYQRELMDIDPFDIASITPEIAEKIAIEIKINPWYFYREIVRIPTQGGRPIRFILNRGNLALIWFFYNNVDIALIQPRQTGKTVSTSAIVGHLMYFLGFHFDIAMLTKDAKLLHDNVARIKDIREALPPYLVYKQRIDEDRKEGLSYEILENRYLAYTNSNNERDALKIGRGQTTPVQHWDEIAFFNYIWITYPSAMAATTTAVTNARNNGLPCSNIITTTAGSPDTKSGSYALDLFNKACRFHESLYDSENKEDLMDRIMKNSQKGSKMIYAVFSHRQLGYSDAWLKETVTRNNATQEEIERDYLNMWKSGVTGGILSQAMLDKLQQNRLEPSFVETIDNYDIYWYVSEELLRDPTYKNRSYIVGMDSSEMIGNDYTTMVILDPYDMGVVATLRCNESNILSLANRVAKLMLTYPKMILVPEARSTGRTIIDVVLTELVRHGINPWTRIYNQVIQRRDEDEFFNFDIYNASIEGKYRKYFGYNTSSTGMHSRNMLYKTVFNKAIHMNYDRIYDAAIIQELCGLKSKNGRIDHADGCHDDMVISYLLACYFIFFGKNLQLYGIDTDKFLNNAIRSEDAISNQKKAEQLQLRSRLAQMEERLRRCPTELIKYTYIREIKNLQALIDPDCIITDTVATSQIDRDNRAITNTPEGTTNQGANSLREFYQGQRKLPTDAGYY